MYFLVMSVLLVLCKVNQVSAVAATIGEAYVSFN